MGRNKDFGKRLGSLEQRLIEHYIKLADEEAKDLPNRGRINYWRREIKGRLKEINYLRRKLGLPERKE